MSCTGSLPASFTRSTTVPAAPSLSAYSAVPIITKADILGQAAAKRELALAGAKAKVATLERQNEELKESLRVAVRAGVASDKISPSDANVWPRRQLIELQSTLHEMQAQAVSNTRRIQELKLQEEATQARAARALAAAADSQQEAQRAVALSRMEAVAAVEAVKAQAAAAVAAAKAEASAIHEDLKKRLAAAEGDAAAARAEAEEARSQLAQVAQTASALDASTVQPGPSAIVDQARGTAGTMARATDGVDENDDDARVLIQGLMKHKGLAKALRGPLQAYAQRCWNDASKLEFSFVSMLIYACIKLDDAAAIDELTEQLFQQHSFLQAAETAFNRAAMDIQKLVRGRIARRFLSKCDDPTTTTRVMVFGSLNMDLRAQVMGAWRGTKGAATMVADSFLGLFDAVPGGKGLNQAVAAARLGVRTHLVGCIGYDALSQSIMEHLTQVSKASPLNISYVAPPSKRAELSAETQRTGVAVQLVSDVDHSKLTVSCLGANKTVGAREVKAAKALLGGPYQFGAILLAVEIEIAPMRAVARLAKEKGVQVMLKTSPLDATRAKGVRALLDEGLVPLIFATGHEVCHLLGVETPMLTVDDADRASARLFEAFPGLRQILIRAELGVIHRSRPATAGEAGRLLVIPTRRQIPVETARGRSSILGAADAYMGGYAAAIAHKLAPEHALLWAHAAGQLAALDPGPQLDGRVPEGVLLRE